jgi:radical SAM superfamily enzyme YgiQ (UPF0313 family)
MPPPLERGLWELTTSALRNPQNGRARRCHYEYDDIAYCEALPCVTKIPDVSYETITQMKTNILLINPPIYDFAAYDLWSKPLGLLYLSAILKAQDVNVHLLDYMDRCFEGLNAYCEQAAHPNSRTHKNICPTAMPQQTPTSSKFKIPKGRHYLKEHVSKPPQLQNVPRNYSRYGLPREMAKSFLSSIPKPDLIIMTSIMTYWYPGVFEAIKTIKAIFPNVPLILGGIYAALCPEHFSSSLQAMGFDVSYETASFAGEHSSPLQTKARGFDVSYETASFAGEQSSPRQMKAQGFNVSYETLSKNVPARTVFLSRGISLAELNPALAALGISAHIPESFIRYPAPDFSFYPKKEYAVLRMSWGCPFRCSYCAQDILSGGGFVSKEPKVIFDEICGFVEQGIKDIVFYDDALLYEADLRLKPLLKLIIASNLNIKIHTPNGLHIRFLDFELSELMKGAGFVMPRFSLETNQEGLQRTTGAKLNNAEFEDAVRMLKKAGFKDGGFMLYLLMGMPGQSFEDIENAIDYVKALGGKVSLSEYSLIPKTRDFEALRLKIGKDILDEPLCHNKSVYPLFDKAQWDRIYALKQKAKL